MLLLTVTVKESYVIAITRESFDWKPIPRSTETLSQELADFRRGLDIANASDATGKIRAVRLERAPSQSGGDKRPATKSAARAR